MRARASMMALLLGCLPAVAGEIIIGPAPAPQQQAAPREREPSRSERELGRSLGKARDYAGTGGTAVVVDDGKSPRPLDKTERAMRDAQEHLRSGGDTSASGTDGTVTLRAAPLSDAERARLKARAYATGEAPRTTRNCSEAATQVGMIGEGAGAAKSGNVVEKGNSAVNVNCR